MKILIQDRILNKEQKKAVEFGEGPLLIIAGAGTGKTTVITERIKYLISSGQAKPQEILALTFTEKASREMEERVDLALPYGVIQMWISTFHSFCDRILRNEGLAIGLDPNFKLMTEAVTIQFFRTNLFAFDLSYFRPLGNPTKFISGMIQHFSRLKDEDVSPNQYMEWVKSKSQNPKLKQIPKSKTQIKDEEKEDLDKYKELANAYRTYEELKTKHGVMDYGDLITYTLKLFRTRKNILKNYQEQFRYLLIDEFQDTNFSQNELAMLLAGTTQNITVVGDDDQAIYRWRGAAISNIIQFRKHFPKAKIVVLTKNYRSTKEILDRSYQLIQNNNPDRLEAVEKIDKKGKGFFVKTKENEYSGKTILFATGTKWKKLEVPGALEFENKGVSFCALCDSPLYKNKIVGLVGGSDSAAKDALVLSEHAKKVYIIYRKEKIHPEPINMKRVEEKIKEGKIEIINNANVLEVKGDRKIRGIKLDREFNEKDELALDGLFIAIGHSALSELAVKLGVNITSSLSILIYPTSTK